MASSTASILESDYWNSGEADEDRGAARLTTAVGAGGAAGLLQQLPFLAIPPFPGARVRRFRRAVAAPIDYAAVAEALKRLRVGGTYWAAQPQLPDEYVLVTSAAAVAPAIRLGGGRPVVQWNCCNSGMVAIPGVLDISGECDPWHMLARASAIVTDAGDQRQLIAALLDVPVNEFDHAARKMRIIDIHIESRLTAELDGSAFANPFTGEAMDVLDAIELCGFWRRLIDSNRDIAGGIGFAFWKQAHVAPLLWGGSTPIRFTRTARDVDPDETFAVWRSKAPAEALAQLERAGTSLIEVEDGFLRSRGLGADCIPPLSITVDRLCAYFDPSRASELELLLENGEFDEATLERAGKLRRLIVDSGLGKYGQGTRTIERPAGGRRHILVPGQVQDDCAVRAGGCGLASNLDLLKRVRARAPDSYILYKPHPDVLAGHRPGVVPERCCFDYADEIVGHLPISSLIAMVDEVHVNTSLAGFEALLRAKPVTTYGVPFYAGWGLTHDLGPVPSRRTRKRSLDELAAAVLLLYPRYLDPVTGLPCPAEIAVARLSAAQERDPGLLVAMRRLQGRLMRRLRGLVQ